MSKNLRTRIRGLRELCLIFIPLVVSVGCAGSHTLVSNVQLDTQLSSSVKWLSPTLAEDVQTLSRWRAGVGSPIVHRTSPTARPSDDVTVVSWNVALGEGDVVSLVRELQSSGRPVVLLLQEAFRSGDDIPRSPLDCAFAGFLGNSQSDREVDAVAEALGFSVYYVPSMRNGAPGRHDEDRGNAILTNLELDNLSAIELPFERQRRVAVGATVHGTSADGRPWSLRFVSAHLDNTGSAKRLWVGGEYGRARQARGLREALTATREPLILGGDFNTWFGFSDRAYHELAQGFPQTKVLDGRRTFRGLLRLDHVFYKLPEGWTATVRRGESSRGSDHYPLIANVSHGSTRSTSNF